MKPYSDNRIKGLPPGQFSNLVNPMWLDTPIVNKATLPSLKRLIILRLR
jgi:hypothetical protein